MIHPIDTAETQEASAQRHAKSAAGAATPATTAAGAATPGDSTNATTAAASTRGKSFAAVLASEKRSVTDTAKAASHSHDHDKHHIDVPTGETWRPVHGHDQYAHITSGPRKGMYINLSDGARRGEVFRVEHRHGKRVHVYGEGKDEKVVLAAKDSGKVHGHHLRRGETVHTARRGRNETWAPVPGHSDYADILSGPRDGYFVNTSGGERDGMVFHIVHRHGREYHIYGHGKDRQVVLVRHHHDAKPDKAKASDAAGGASPN